MINWFKSNPEEGARQTPAQVIWELLKVLVVSFAIVVPVRLFIFQPFYVQGQSMEPTFEDHDYLIIDELSYRFNEPKRGDTVVFRYPADPSQYYIKRMIGLPGERVTITDSVITIYSQQYPKGLSLDESYLDPKSRTYVEGNWLDITLGKEEFFLLGDNRLNSSDSRRFGPVNHRYLIGRVWLRGWPVSKATAFGGYDYTPRQ
ncbi:MAG: signal peptidase I [bacterium]